MRRRLGLVLLLLASLAVALLPSPVGAGGVTFRMRIWMLPPMDVTGDDACLSNRWHGAGGTDDQNHALDWQSTCGENSSKVVRFRALAAAPDDLQPGSFTGAAGEPIQMANVPCGVGTVRYARVRIRSNWDGLVKGKATYGHVTVSSETTFGIIFEAGGFSSAYFNSIGVADTKNDSSAGSNCWTGWHVHENNSTDPGWDSWSGIWGSAGLCDCHQNDDPANWIRRLAWTE